MSDVQSNVKPLTLTTGRVIFAIAGVCVTQGLVSALSSAAVLTRAGARWRIAGACRCDNPVHAALGAGSLFGRRGSNAGGFRPVARNAVRGC